MLNLTAEEKVLTALSAFHRFKDDVEAPFETTQGGLSLKLDLRRSHVSIALKGLKRKGMVSESLSHVKNSVRRKKVYFLTEKGLRHSEDLSKQLYDEDVVLKDGAKEEKMKLKALLKSIPGKPKVFEILSQIKNNVFDLGLYKKMDEDRETDFSDSLPEIRYFFGREEELKGLREFLDSKTYRIFALKGIAGIGKTTLLTKFAIELKRNEVFIYRVCEWSTLRNILNRLADFLLAKGRRALKSYLRTQDVPDIEDAIAIASKDMSGLRSISGGTSVLMTEISAIRALFSGGGAKGHLLLIWLILAMRLLLRTVKLARVEITSSVSSVVRSSLAFFTPMPLGCGTSSFSFT